MSKIAKTIISILIINGSTAVKKEEDRCYLDFGNFSINYNPSKAASASGKSGKGFKLNKIRDAVNHGRSYNEITRVYFCEQTDDTSHEVRYFGTTFRCNLPKLEYNPNCQSSPNTSIEKIYEKNYETNEASFWKNRLFYFEQGCPKEYKYFYWPFQNCWEGEKCVSCNEQAIFLFKEDKAFLSGEKKKKNVAMIILQVKRMINTR